MFDRFNVPMVDVFQEVNQNLDGWVGSDLLDNGFSSPGLVNDGETIDDEACAQILLGMGYEFNAITGDVTSRKRKYEDDESSAYDYKRNAGEGFVSDIAEIPELPAGVEANVYSTETKVDDWDMDTMLM